MAEDLRDTKERLLDAAEELFAHNGFAGTSLRAITAGAGANLAAVNYHYGSKEELIGAVFARRIAPINAERLALLDRLEARGDFTVEEVVEAFMAPPMRAAHDPVKGRAVLHIAQMVGHATSQHDPSIRDLVVGQFQEVFECFTVALRRLLPELPEAEIPWRVLFMVGSMSFTLSMSADLKRVSDGMCDPSDVEATLQRLVPFVAAGMRAATPLRVSEATS